MITISTERAQARLTISQALFAVAGVVLGGMFTGVFFVVDKRVPGLAFWILLALSAVLLVFSFLAGGWGIEKLNNENPHFNRQALAVLTGFIVLAVSLFFLGPEKEDSQGRAIAQIQRDLGAEGANQARLNEEFVKVESDLAARGAELQQLRVDVQDLSRRLGSNTSSPPKMHRQ